MAFESLKAEIDLLLEQMINEPQDLEELRIKLRETLNEMSATGMPLPEDLVQLQARLDAGEEILPPEDGEIAPA